MGRITDRVWAAVAFGTLILLVVGVSVVVFPICFIVAPRKTVANLRDIWRHYDLS